MSVNEKCPQCGNLSVIKTPQTRIMTEKLGCMLHTANEFNKRCYHPGCNYKTEPMHVKTDLGNRLSRGWWKIF
jgi:hypothetical protein